MESGRIPVTNQDQSETYSEGVSKETFSSCLRPSLLSRVCIRLLAAMACELGLVYVIPTLSRHSCNRPWMRTCTCSCLGVAAGCGMEVDLNESLYGLKQASR